MKKKKPVVGQTLYALNVGNAARRTAQVLRPVKVVSVGRKYFTASGENLFTTEFHLDTWREKTDYSADYVLYESEQEWLDEKEAAELCKQIGKAFEYGRNFHDITLPDLRSIRVIIERTPV